MKNQKKFKFDKEKALTRFLVVAMIITLSATLTALFLFYEQVKKSNAMSNTVDKEYDRWYVLINDNYDAFWQILYNDLKTAGDEKGVYVEWLGKDLAADYTKEQLMEIAINSKVDGIILQGEDSPELYGMVRRAADSNIPVVAVMQDMVTPSRISYVGPSNYNLGTEYGNQILKAAKETRSRQILQGQEEDREDTIDVLVLTQQGASQTAQNLIISAMREVLGNGYKSGMNINMSVNSVRDANAFAIEEDIREIFDKTSESVPDIVVCLSELTTNNVYQMVVDQDMVGDVSIIGYFDSESILKAVEKGVVYATSSIDTKQMGEYCVEALSDRLDTGYTNEYYSADFTMVTKGNVGAFLAK